MDLPANLADLLGQGVTATGKLVVLTGAGVSAESGIPTFRGADGLWTIGSRNYRPEELATRQAFMQMPEEMWAWYLYRRSLCLAALPNAAHRALVDLEEVASERFLLITQNVDGLHLRAGSTSRRTYEIHGNIDFMRCSRECSSERFEVPLTEAWPRGKALEVRDVKRLVCPRCGAMNRPCVLWFDETYDEERYRYESSIDAAEMAALLLVVGTSGMTSLPMRVAEIVALRQVPMVVVDPEPNAFRRLAEESGHGAFLQGKAGDWVPKIVEELIDLLRDHERGGILECTDES